MQELIASRERALALRDRMNAGEHTEADTTRQNTAWREIDVRVAEIAAHHLGH